MNSFIVYQEVQWWRVCILLYSKFEGVLYLIKIVVIWFKTSFYVYASLIYASFFSGESSFSNNLDEPAPQAIMILKAWSMVMSE